MSGQDRGGKKTVMHKVHVLKFVGADLPPRTIVARISDEAVDRSGDIVVSAGCDHAAFDRNPVVLWQHNADRPIGQASLRPGAGFIDAVITFAPEGVSADADTAYGLVKAGVVRGISVGFLPIDYDPLPRGGTKYVKWELLEVSIVSVPANPNATVSRKAARDDRASLVAQIKACLNKSERAHIDALDAHDAFRDGDAEAGAALDEMRRAVSEARSHVDAARDLADRLPGASGDDGDGDDGELAFIPSRRKSAAALDAVDVGAARPIAAPTPETRGGAFLTAKVRADEQERLRRMWGG